MKRIYAVWLVAAGLLIWMSFHVSNAAPTANDDCAAIRQLGQDMGDAMVSGDVDKLDQIIADDWKSMGMSGSISTKEDFLRDMRSGKHKLLSFKLGPIDVQVFGNVAAAHGGVTETRTDDGKDTSGEFIYMDLLQKRGDRWVVVRSAGARVK